MNETAENIKLLSEKLVMLCSERGIKISTAESCTGGMISSAITSVPGSSEVIEFGICSYSNRIKHEVLGVSEQTLDRFSEYSIQCVEEMAKGALRLSGADFAVATSGVAGPSGGTDANPVGTVYIDVCGKGKFHSKRFLFADADRALVRLRTAEKGLTLLIEIIENNTQQKGNNNV